MPIEIAAIGSIIGFSCKSPDSRSLLTASLRARNPPQILAVLVPPSA